MSDFVKEIHAMFDHIWDCEIDHPVFQDTVGELMEAVIQAYEKHKPTLGTNLAEVGTDCISRQAAIDALTEYGNGRAVFISVGEAVIRIEQLPPAQPEPHWIPVTERSPETSDAVLTTYIVNGDRSRRYVEESSYYGNDESWSSPWDEYRIAGTRIEVIAWKPMPEPYKGVTE